MVNMGEMANLGRVLREGKSIEVIYSPKETSTTINFTHRLGNAGDEDVLRLFVGENLLFELADGKRLTVKINKFRLTDRSVNITGSVVKRHFN
jgi:hypothetical protein